ncbi:uncharacterized protein [Chironomus tepperi]|uniref:uncharacterized protein n=1 Tax=Chironomus tepperi TaxID=113505 RepID=UPI00391EE633
MDALDFTKEIPSWLDQNLFDTAIRSFEADPNAKVNNFDIKPATKPGENFASAVFRATIKFTSKYQKDEQEVSVIIKTQPVNVDLPNMDHLKDPTLFRNEIGVYTNVLEKMQELITSVGYTDIMCPRLVYQTMTPKPVIILEDVTSSGYDTAFKTMHDDFEISKRIVRRLAKFHAASFYLQDEQKIDASQFDTSIYKHDFLLDLMFTESFDVITELMSKWEGFQQFVEPIKKFKTCYAEMGLKSYTPTSGSGAFNVLNHGDFHFKNVLYKMTNDGKEIEDFIAYDYQICCYASPAIDLVYILYNFVSDENRFARYDEFLDTYHKQFVEALKKFGYLNKPPTLLDLQIEMMKNGNLQAQIGIFTFPYLILDVSSFTADDYAAGPRMIKMKAFENERYKRVMKEALPIFLRKGFFGN